jgi:ABC-2 type transport system permease protein/capsular polysaccharide transport system permease protein
MPSNSSTPQTGALLRSSSWEINRRVIGALLIREVLTRYGRNNIGFLWLFVEPTIFVMIITLVWSTIRTSDLPIVAFAVTGYSSLLLWRNTAGRCIGAMKSNKSLLFHRQVTIVDIFAARILLELIAVTMAFVALTIVFYAIDWLTLPEDVLQVIGGWLLLFWFAAGLGMVIGGLAEKAEVVGRLWHPVSYLLMIGSGVAFTVDSLPPRAQNAALWIPMMNAVEFIREGWFGSTFRAHYDIEYLIACNVALTLVGLSLVRQIGIDTSEE